MSQELGVRSRESGCDTRADCEVSHAVERSIEGQVVVVAVVRGGV